MTTRYDPLRSAVESITAIESAELFLSPYIREDILLEALREPGPTLWIVNRSDVSDKVLDKLTRHSLPQISLRAGEKLKSRYSSISHLATPIVEQPLDEIESYGIEDVLGHPLCSWEAMLFFAQHSDEDVRASACLSLTRRLFEHPKQNVDLPLIQEHLRNTFGSIAQNDLSPMVRSYAARAPLWSEEEVGPFFAAEKNPRVKAKWLQNDFSSYKMFETVSEIPDDLFFQRAYLLDGRLPQFIRKKYSSSDLLCNLINEAYLQ